MRVFRLRKDDGFTLTELMVVLLLLGFVLSVAYGLLQITQIGTNAASREAWMAREVAAPLEFAERVLSQQYQIQTGSNEATPYRIAFLTNRAGGAGERYVIEATTDNELAVTSSQNVTDPEYHVGVWSDANFNRQADEPLFRYFDADGVEITDMSNVHYDARYVIVTIVTMHQGRQFSDSRTIFFRN